MIAERPEDVTAAALAVMARTEDPRLREIMTILVRHLHAFVVEARLSEDEFRAATAIVNEIGQRSTATHNEAVLMAGSLGVSALVCLLNNGDGGRVPTSQNLLGPFWRLGSPRVEQGGSLVRSRTPGTPLFAEITVLDVAGRPVEGAEIDIWHASPVGYYENQDPDQPEMNLRGKFTTDPAGRIAFRSVRPSGYPIPTDGVVGRLLKAQERHPYRPAHLHALVFKPGFKTLTAQIYDAEDPYLETDVQFGVTRALVARFVEHTGPHPTAGDVGAAWYALAHTLTLEPGEARLPRPPIR